VDPILIAAPPRSGTSMVAGLLAQHGVDPGNYKKRMRAKGSPRGGNPRGGFEDIYIKAVLKKILQYNGYELHPINVQPTSFYDDPEFRDRILELVNDPEQLWLFKEFRILMTWPLWYNAFPNAMYVLNYRNKRDTLESMLKHKTVSLRGNRRGLEFWIDWARRRQKKVAKYCPHVWTYVDRIWQYDMVETRKIVEACGLKFNEQTARNWIEAKFWHNREGASQ